MQLILVTLRQKKQLTDERTHVVGFCQDRIDGFLQNLRIALAPAVNQIRITLNDGNGCPQLMGRIGNKLTLPLKRPIQSVNHGVKRNRQLLHLILRAFRGNPLTQVLDGNPFCRRANRFNGAQNAVTDIFPNQKCTANPKNIHNQHFYKKIPHHIGVIPHHFEHLNSIRICIRFKMVR